MFAIIPDLIDSILEINLPLIIWLTSAHAKDKILVQQLQYIYQDASAYSYSFPWDYCNMC